MLCAVPAGGETPTPAQADSLVWYIEQLEYDLAVCQIRAGARADTLQIRNELLAEQLRWANEDRAKWYHKPGLWFIIGSALGIWVAGSAVKVTF